MWSNTSAMAKTAMPGSPRAASTWSRSTRLAFDQIHTWFGVGPKALQGLSSTEGEPRKSDTADKFVWCVLGLNAIPLLFNFWQTFLILLFAIIFIYTLAQPGEDQP